jgi:hypothetical protein
MARKGFDIQAEIRELADLSREELVARWAKAHGCAPPKGVRQELLARSAAWHLQAKRLGGYTTETRRLLRSAIMEASKRLADRTGASGKARQVEDKNGDNAVHKLGGEVSATFDDARDHRSHIEDAASAPPATPSPVFKILQQRSEPSSLSTSNSSAVENSDGFISIATGASPPVSRERRQRRKLQPGARLLRGWNGKTHVVDVIEGGYVFEAKVYPSLTAIAGKITGAHWSGPRFFGL